MIRKRPALFKAPKIVLAALLIAHPLDVSIERLIDAVYGDDPDGGALDAEGVIGGAMTILRKHGWQIETQGNRALLILPQDGERLTKAQRLTRAELAIAEAIKQRPNIRLADLAERLGRKPSTIAVQICKLKRRLELAGAERLVNPGRGAHAGYRIETVAAT